MSFCLPGTRVWEKSSKLKSELHYIVLALLKLALELQEAPQLDKAHSNHTSQCSGRGTQHKPKPTLHSTTSDISYVGWRKGVRFSTFYPAHHRISDQNTEKTIEGPEVNLTKHQNTRRQVNFCLIISDRWLCVCKSKKYFWHFDSCK